LVVKIVENPLNSCIIDVQVVESLQVEFSIKFGIGLDENWVFGVKNHTSRQRPVITRHGELLCGREQCLLATASKSSRHGESPSSSIPFSYSCVVSTCFCFGLAFGMNLKVLGDIVSSNGFVIMNNLIYELL